MKREEYESLVSSPGWTAFKTFLRDRRADVMEAIAGGYIVEDDREKAVRECIVYKQLINLTWDQVEAFYNKEPA